MATLANSYDKKSLYVGEYINSINNSKSLKIFIPLSKGANYTLNKMMHKNESLDKNTTLTWFSDLSQTRYYALTPEQYDFYTVQSIVPLPVFADNHNLDISSSDEYSTIYDLTRLEILINQSIKPNEQTIDTNN